MLFERLSFCLRCILTTAGAVALLFTLSYPDSLLPPTPDIDYVQGFTVYNLKPIIWLVPLLFMEIVSCAGAKRNRVWFISMGAVLTGALLACPVLIAHAPEWVTPSFPFEDGKLRMGLFYFAIIMAVSFLLRCGLFVYLFREPNRDDSDEIAMDADALDLSKAHTVREIAANPVHVKPRFLFGDPDQSLIDRFLRLMRNLSLLRRRKYLLFALIVLLAALWFFLYPRPTSAEALQRDLRVMYEHTQLRDGSFRASPRATHAALRVLRYVSDKELFAGKTPAQAEAWLQLQRAPEAYRTQLRDDSELSLASTDAVFESRTRFFTVSDGKRTVVLFIRTNKDGDRINVSETVDAGWNAVADERRRRFGSDIGARFFSR